MQLTDGAAGKAALGAVILYLIAHGLSGQQGLIAYVGLQARERALEAESEALSREIAALQDRAGRLRTGSARFDRDYLEERARTLIDAMRADEIAFELAALTDGQNAAQP